MLTSVEGNSKSKDCGDEEGGVKKVNRSQRGKTQSSKAQCASKYETKSLCNYS